MLYFYDDSGRYSGCRARTDGEPIPARATETPVEVPDGYEANFCDGTWAVTEIAAPTAPAEHEPTDVETLQAKNARLEEMLAQTNTDFAGFMDYYFAANPE